MLPNLINTVVYYVPRCVFVCASGTLFSQCYFSDAQSWMPLISKCPFHGTARTSNFCYMMLHDNTLALSGETCANSPTGRLMSFAKAKREHKKIEARQEKRDLDEKYKAMEDEPKLKHADELAAFQPEVPWPTDAAHVTGCNPRRARNCCQ